jgi:hypothetical protein
VSWVQQFKYVELPNQEIFFRFAKEVLTWSQPSSFSATELSLMRERGGSCSCSTIVLSEGGLEALLKRQCHENFDHNKISYTLDPDDHLKVPKRENYDLAFI